MNDPKLHLSTPMGIHRVMREPYDDREIFTSMADLLEYCKHGARYNGQKVGCIIGASNKSDQYIQKFTIHNDFPIIELDGCEHEISSDGNGVLIYYYNPLAFISSNRKMFDSAKSHLNYLADPFKFSILWLLDAFKTSVHQETIEVVVYSTPVTNINPTEDYVATETSTTLNLASFTAIPTGTTNNCKISGLMIPTDNSATNEVKAYVKAPEYIEALGEVR